jgi:hypothetical protein
MAEFRQPSGSAIARCAVSYYRAYIVDQDDRFVDAIDLDCADDGAAIESARQLVDGHDIELWQEKRLVTMLAASDDK